jgi:hypothetical protein
MASGPMACPDAGSDTHVAGHRQQGTTRRNVHGDRAKLPVQHRHLLVVAQRDHDHPDQPVLCLQLGVVGPVMLGDVPTAQTVRFREQSSHISSQRT